MGLNEQGIIQTVSMAGFLNGEHSKAQLPEVTFSCSLPSGFQNGPGLTHKYIWEGGMHTATEYTCPPAPTSKNGRAEYLPKNMKIIFVTHTVLCCT